MSTTTILDDQARLDTYRQKFANRGYTAEELQAIPDIILVALYASKDAFEEGLRNDPSLITEVWKYGEQSYGGLLHTVCWSEIDVLDKVSYLLTMQNIDVNDSSQHSSGCTPAFIAAQNGHANVITALHEAGADLNKAKEDNGCTPALIAAQQGHAAVITALHEAGADLNKAKEDNGCTPALIAAQQGHNDTLQQLINYGVNIEAQLADGTTPLTIAIARNHGAIVTLLLQNGASVANINNPDIQRQRQEIDARLRAAISITSEAWEDPDTPLHQAVRFGDVAIISAILSEHSAECIFRENKAKETPMSIACARGNEAVIKELSRHVGLRKEKSDPKKEDQLMHAIHQAVSTQHVGPLLRAFLPAAG